MKLVSTIERSMKNFIENGLQKLADEIERANPIAIESDRVS